MKTLLQLDLESNFNKKYYSISKEGLQISTQEPKYFPFHNICYKAEDINTSILYDIVLQFSQNTNTQIEDFTIFLDRTTHDHCVKSLLTAIGDVELFKRDRIDVGHFTIFNDCLYDYHRKNWDQIEENSQPQTEKSKKKKKDLSSSEQIQFESRDMVIFEEIKPQQIHLIPETITYTSIKKIQDQPHFLSSSSKFSKSQMAKKHQQIENKKIIEFYIIKLGNRGKINIVAFKYNKSYILGINERKQLSDLLMLYGAGKGEIKYKTINVELINIFLKNAKKLFYVMYFPLPLNDIQIVSRQKEKDRKISPNKFQQNKIQSLETYIEEAFMNLSFLISKEKQTHQKIILSYLEEKEHHLKQELDKMSERLRDLKVIHRVEQQQIAQITSKSRKALEKIYDNIIYLRNNGVKNIRKHIEWLKSISEEKKALIKDQEQQIDFINKRIIQSRKNHDYFVEKMQAYRLKLEKTFKDMLKKKQNSKKVKIYAFQKTNTDEKSSNRETSKLSSSQKEELDQYKEKLKQQLRQRLKNCKQKQVFTEHLAQLKKRVTKIEISKFQQKYIDLLHD